MTLTTNLLCQPEVQTNRLGVADVQKAVGLRRKARHNFGDLAARYLVAYLVANEVWRWGGLVGHGGVDNLMVDGVLGKRCKGNQG